ncbi:MAG: hypothetical protein QXH55_05670 [Candidatus Korarchaeota archaeon]|nr:hypothetical protein [Thermoproteota archaeon]
MINKDLVEEIKRIVELIPKKELEKPPFMLLLVEEFARIMSELTQKQIPTIQPKTYIVDIKNFVIDKEYEIINVNCAGHLKELIIVSTNTNFSINLVLDGIILFESLENLMSISEELESVDAYEKDGKYVLRITDLKWVKNIIISIKTTNPIQFERIFVNYDLLVRT